MKQKVFFILLYIILTPILTGCTDDRAFKENDISSLYGMYTFKEVSYLSGLSSSTKDSVNSRMAGTKYTIKADLLKIENIENTFEIKTPKYVKEEIPKDVTVLSDVRSFIGNEVICQYSIEESHWRLYVSKDSLWIALYNDNTVDGSEVIMSIYKLGK